MDEMPNFLLNVLLRQCNNQIDELHAALAHINQYVVCFNCVVPKEHKQRVINELELLNNDFNTPLAYQIEDINDPNAEDFCLISLFNTGAVQKQAVLLTRDGKHV